LVGVSLVPAWFGLGAVYLGAAAVGGAVFLWTAAKLTRDPTRARAMACFHASLAQLTLVLIGAMIDGAWVS
jgi:protoheme IX farnesyltransferase